MQKLTIKQQRFIDEYLKTGNGTESARKAGYSYKTAGVIANEMLKKPYIIDYINEKQKEFSEKGLISLEECLQKLTDIINSPESTPKDVMKALDMRLKTLGAYSSTINANVNQVNIVVEVEEEENEY